jgi:hypothetical protein
VVDYFPDALAAVAEVSRIGNDQHNPGQPLHWDKTKSTDHADSLMRHLVQRGTHDSDGARHSAKVAWRALALLQVEIENSAERLVPEEAENLFKVTLYEQAPEAAEIGDNVAPQYQEVIGLNETGQLFEKGLHDKMESVAEQMWQLEDSAELEELPVNLPRFTNINDEMLVLGQLSEIAFATRDRLTPAAQEALQRAMREGYGDGTS